MSQAELDGVLMFGSHHEYDGDQPWWTLRFKKALSADEKIAVTALLEASNVTVDGNFCPLEWESERQCQWETGDPWFPNQKAWQRFYAKVDQVLADLHSEFPLFAIFLQEGQFYDHAGPEESLAGLTDEQLVALRAR